MITDQQFLDISQVIAEGSYCKKKQVGAIIVKDNRIIASGYNGTPSGLPNNCEDSLGMTLPIVLHAESNAIAFAARNGIPLEGATLYVTISPCVECAKSIIQAGIARVVYGRLHKTDGLEILKQCKVSLQEGKP